VFDGSRTQHFERREHVVPVRVGQSQLVAGLQATAVLPMRNDERLLLVRVSAVRFPAVRVPAVRVLSFEVLSPG